MIKLNEKIRIIQLDQYNMTFEIYKEVENIKTHEKTIKWVRVGGYYGNLNQCTKAIKDYLIAEENQKNDNLDIISYLNEINESYKNCGLDIIVNRVEN